jgi:hypothetical protein
VTWSVDFDQRNAFERSRQNCRSARALRYRIGHCARVTTALNRVVVVATIVCVLAVATGSASAHGASTPGTTTVEQGSPLPASPGVRDVGVRSFTVTKEHGIGFALHPTSDPIRFHASSSGLELCPSAADAELAAVVSEAPLQGPLTCTPFDAAGDAVGLSLRGGASHMGFVVRAGPGAQAVRIRDLSVQYVAVDQFFILFPPTGEAGNLRVFLTPVQARTVAAQTFLFPNRRALGAPRIAVGQGNHRLRREERNVNLDAAPYGPARLNNPVRVRIVGRTSPTEVVGLLLEWA